MKKQLMTTSALVAAGVMATATVAQAKPKLSLGGWFEGIVGIVDDDNNGGISGGNQTNSHVNVDVQQDSEIFFKGSVTLDNGIKIRTRVELEGQSSNSADTIDEAYMDISGSFGAVRVGSDDNAAHLMTTSFMGSWATNVGQNLNFDISDWVEAPAGHHSNVDRLDLGDADSEKITYFTPRVAGFQAGVSYMPSFSEGDNGEPEQRSENFHSGWAAAVNYRGKISGVGLGAALGYATAKPNNEIITEGDPSGVAGGVYIDVSSFRISYGYHHEWNLVNDNNNAADDGTTAHDFGVRYKAGKNNFSVGYKTSETDGAANTAGEDKTDLLMLSYRRDLGPGVQYRLNFMWADYSGENLGSADDNEGMALTTSVRLAF